MVRKNKRGLLACILAMLFACFCFSACENGKGESEGLEYTLSEDGASYLVSGMGTCTDTEVIIPSEYEGKAVTGIGDSAFYLCESMEYIFLPDSIMTIGESAFYGCTSLTEVRMPSEMTRIGIYAFYGCTLLFHFSLPEGLTEIADWTFFDCTWMITVTIPNTVTKIGTYAFTNCYNLLAVSIGSGVTDIGRNAFLDCANLSQVSFVNPNGWVCVTEGETDTAVTLDDQAMNSSYLSIQYANAEWLRKN